MLDVRSGPSNPYLSFPLRWSIKTTWVMCTVIGLRSHQEGKSKDHQHRRSSFCLRALHSGPLLKDVYDTDLHVPWLLSITMSKSSFRASECLRQSWVSVLCLLSSTPPKTNFRINRVIGWSPTLKEKYHSELCWMLKHNMPIDMMI